MNRCKYAFSLPIFIAGTVLSSSAHAVSLLPPAAGTVQQADEQVLDNANRVIAGLRALENAPANRRGMEEAKLQALAIERNARLLALLERSPSLAKARTFPPGLLKRMPPGTRHLFEENVEVSGKVTSLIAEDMKRGVHKQLFYLTPDNDPAAAPMPLHLATDANPAVTMTRWVGKRLKAKAIRIDGRLLLDEVDGIRLEELDGTGTAPSPDTGGMAPMTAPLVSGAKQTLVAAFHFKDKTLECTASELADRYFGPNLSANHNLREASGNAVSLGGKVIGPIKIDVSSTEACEPRAVWEPKMKAAIAAAGYDIAQFNLVSYVHPSNQNCGWAGIAEVPGKYSWIAACKSQQVVVHELGHNLGFHHANTSTAEYADWSSPMGNGGRAIQFNAANRVAAGWLPAGTTVQDVTSGSSYSISPLEDTAPAASQVLRIAKPDTNEFYYLSLRQPIGLDANLPSQYLSNISVHRSGGALKYKTHLMANLGVGQVFTDNANGIRITPQSITSTGAIVSVTFGATGCTRSRPGVSFSPASISTQNTQQVWYQVSIRNNNSTGCGAQTFDLSATGPATGNTYLDLLPGNKVSLSPGQSTTVQLGLQSYTLADGTYPVTLTARDSNDSTNASTGQASYILYSACTRAAPALTISPTSQSGAAGSTLKYQATLKNNHGEGCAASTFQLAQTLPTGFSGTLTPSSVSLSPGASTVIAWPVTSSSNQPGATYSLKLTATDTAAPTYTASGQASYGIAPTSLSCVRAVPTVSLSPTAQIGRPGDTLPYSVTVRNNNNSGCGTSTFRIAATRAAGLSGELPATSVSLGASASKTFSWPVTSAATLADGTYSISVAATDTGSLGKTATANGSYAVKASVPTLHVGSITMKLVDVATLKTYPQPMKRATATVTVRDRNGKPIPGAVVRGTWSGLVSQTAEKRTIFSVPGTVTFYSPSSYKSGSFTFTVNSIVLSGYAYDPARNVMTSSTITRP